MDTEELDKLRTQLIKGISKLHEIASSKRKPLAELGNKGCLRELERLRKRERELKEQNDRLNKALGLYKERRRKDREAVEQWTTYARELETANEQLLNDLRKSRDDVVDITPSSQVMLPTDSTCDEIDLEMSFHEEEVPIKQEPKSSRESRESDQRSDGTQIKQEPHSSPDYGRTESQLPQHLIPDSIDLEAPIYEVKSSQSDMELSSSAMDLTSSAIMVPSNVTMSITPVIPSKRAAKQPDFRSEIDQDLRSGERRVMFDQVEVQLPTPKTSSAQRRVTDHWLKRDLNRLSSDTPNTTETPTKLRATEADVKAPCDENRENESELLGSYNSNFTHKESLIERLKQKTWHPSDFIINPDHNDSLNYAFKDTDRGNKRQCEHGYDCVSCAKFYQTAGPVLAPATPQWSVNCRNNRSMETSTAKGSRHKDHWQRQASPPGFWRSDFPNTQETAEEKQALEEYRAKEAGRRFEEAILSRKYLFRDPKIRDLLTELK